MEINKLVFGGLVIGCLAAAGGGAYLATRHNADGTQGTAVASPAPVAEPATVATEQPVTASEGVVTPEPAAPKARPPRRPPPSHPPRRPRPPVRNAPPRRRVPRPLDATLPRPPRARRRLARPGRLSRCRRPPRPRRWRATAVRCGRPGRRSSPRSPNARLRAPEPVAPPEPQLVELVVPADAVVGLQLETTVSSDRAKVEDAVEARVTRDVRVDGRVAIPAGSLVQGTVTEVVRGGKVRERARLSIRFHTVVVGNGDRLDAAHRRDHPRGQLAGPRERDEDRRRRCGRRDPGRNPRRRQGRGDRRRGRRRRRHRGGHGRRSQHGHDSRRARPSACGSSSPCRSPSRRSDRRHLRRAFTARALSRAVACTGPAVPAGALAARPQVQSTAKEMPMRAVLSLALALALAAPALGPDQGDVSRASPTSPASTPRWLAAAPPRSPRSTP